MARLRSIILVVIALLLVLFVTACGKKPELNPSNRNNANNENNENNVSNGVLKQNGATCLDNEECESGTCRLQVCVASLCNDSIKNGAETDVDCGAPGCPTCEVGKACEEGLDCISGICDEASSTCIASRCEDMEKNGLETDVDCGGLFCEPCADGSFCLENVDCESEVCDANGTCLVPTCMDMTTNGDETDVDCGGSCEPCADLLACEVPGDCVSGVCNGNVCSIPTCMDGVQNGAETGMDCGGPECGQCGDGVGCSADTDCISLVCGMDDLCAAASCTDGELNGNETDEDCGGDTCPACAPGDICVMGGDCASFVCDMAECAPSLCTDFILNGDETDVDCGGSCQGCADGRDCVIGADCASLICTGGTCQASGCSDGQANGDETDVDCGGSCNTCAAGQMCNDPSDCSSGSCVAGFCVAGACNDGIRNGLETDVDCGSLCPPCADGLACNFNFDCESDRCTGGTCDTPLCTDGAQNGNETDIDCGGIDCPACTVGDTCDVNTDCASMICGGLNNDMCAICAENTTQVTATQCGYQGRGRVEERCTNGQWGFQACVGEWYRSCAEILDAGASVGDGLYDIDPDGPSMLYDEFEVFCDMTTDGGGWTEITACDAERELFGEMTAVDSAATARINSCSPTTRDEGDSHTYYYTFNWPAGFSEFFLNDFEIKANSGENANSELGHIQADWQVGFSAASGDVSFGSGTQVGPITSYSRFPATASTQCFDCVVTWPDGTQIYSVNQTSTRFRIGWGETGGEEEGWSVWHNGTIRIR